MSSGPDQNLEDKDVAGDAADTRSDGPGVKRSGAGDASSPATQLGSRLKQWGITLSYLVIAVVIIALIRTFVIQSFTIPSGSMEDTLTEGDRVTVTMYDSRDIERGDVVVFTDPDQWLTTQEPTGLQGAIQDFLVAIRIFPKNAGHHLIKRVIGMPGDHLVADGRGSLSVNGVEIHEDYLKPGRSSSDIAFDVTVPEGHVWVMGDNRSNSRDSRYHIGERNGGFVPVDNVAGRAWAIFYPFSRFGSIDDASKVFAGVP